MQLRINAFASSSPSSLAAAPSTLLRLGWVASMPEPLLHACLAKDLVVEFSKTRQMVTCGSKKLWQHVTIPQGLVKSSARQRCHSSVPCYLKRGILLPGEQRRCEHHQAVPGGNRCKFLNNCQLPSKISCKPHLH